jgi:hypothetical protein
VRYFNSYMGADANVIDVMIADETHRIRETSNNRFTPRVKESKLSQIDELLKASRTSVFFIDDNLDLVSIFPKIHPKRPLLHRLHRDLKLKFSKK